MDFKCVLLNVRSLSGHTMEIYDFISSEKICLFIMTETWLSNSATPALLSAIPGATRCGRKIEVQLKGVVLPLILGAL